TILVGSLDSLAPSVTRYRTAWDEHQGVGARTAQGDEPMIGLVVHLVVAETDDEAIRIATPAWEKYRWNLAAPRRLEAERGGLTHEHALRSIELFAAEVMPRYGAAAPAARVGTP